MNNQRIKTSEVWKTTKIKEKMIEDLVTSAQQAPLDKYLSTIKKTKQVGQH